MSESGCVAVYFTNGSDVLGIAVDESGASKYEVLCDSEQGAFDALSNLCGYPINPASSPNVNPRVRRQVQEWMCDMEWLLVTRTRTSR